MFKFLIILMKKDRLSKKKHRSSPSIAHVMTLIGCLSMNHILSLKSNFHTYVALIRQKYTNTYHDNYYQHFIKETPTLRFDEVKLSLYAWTPLMTANVKKRRRDMTKSLSRTIFYQFYRSFVCRVELTSPHNT